MDQRLAPQSACQVACMVRFHHFGSGDLDWWSGKSGRLRTYSGLPDLGRWLLPGGSGGLGRQI